MPEQNIHVLQEVGTLEELYDQVAKLQKTLRYLLSGHLDFENISAKGIRAQNIDVDQLSAISADMGKLTSGEIYGAYIATSETSYPKAEMSNTNNLFGAYGTPTRYTKIEANPNTLGAPGMRFGFDGLETLLSQIPGGAFTIYSPSGNVIVTASRVRLGSAINLNGNSDLKTHTVPGAYDLDSCIAALNQMTAVLKDMGILS